MTLVGAARKIRRKPVAAVGLALVFSWVLVALMAPLIAPYPPNAQDYSTIAMPTPSLRHWLGTDQLGRDILSRLIWGARKVLSVAPIAVLAAYLAGGALGAFAAWSGGWIDQAVNRGFDVILSFPVLILYVILIVSIGPSVGNVVFAVAFTSTPVIGRIVRGLVLELKRQGYVEAARMRGERGWWIVACEILPNARGPLIVDACIRLGWTITKIGVLGFLGLGLPPPDPDWGGMVKESTGLMIVWPHMAIFPSLAIVSLVVGFNLIADGLQGAERRL